jgi:4-diphosphocytidyl-2-C-methyl-D-erythritol kinase
MQRVKARAKLTLSLRIVGRRADGYHLLDAEMVTLDLADELTFEDGEGFDVRGRDGVALDAGSFDLIPRAVAAVGRRARVRLDKRIPVGAGLGGGSADAAAVLRWAGNNDLALAVSLGADVPFCLVGGRARVRGVGEIVEPLPFVARQYTLLTPPFPVSTAAVYRRWDALGGTTADGSNDLEPAALAVEPALAEWRDRLGAATGQTPQLAGSGSTWFVDGAFADVAGAVVTRTDRP